MAQTFTLSELMTRVRRRCDMENSNFVSDAELREYINGSLTALWDLLLKADPSRFQTYEVITGDGSTAEFPVPADYYGTVGIDFLQSGDITYALERITGRDRNRFLLQSAGDSIAYDFRYNPNNPALPLLRLFPRPYNGNLYLHHYIVAAPKYATDGTDDAEVIHGINGWEEYVVIDAAIKCLSKEESPPAALERQLAAMTDRLIDAAENRAIENAGYVIDAVTPGYEDPADFWDYKPFRH